MNLREGIKRIYILFSIMCVLVAAAVPISDMPTKKSDARDAAYDVAFAVATSKGIMTIDLPERTMADSDFIDSYCNSRLTLTVGKEQNAVKVETDQNVCSKIKSNQDSLLIRQAKVVGMSVLSMAATVLVLVLLFLTVRWIANGFAAKK